MQEYCDENSISSNTCQVITNLVVLRKERDENSDALQDEEEDWKRILRENKEKFQAAEALKASLKGMSVRRQLVPGVSEMIENETSRYLYR